MNETRIYVDRQLRFDRVGIFHTCNAAIISVLLAFTIHQSICMHVFKHGPLTMIGNRLKITDTGKSIALIGNPNQSVWIVDFDARVNSIP